MSVFSGGIKLFSLLILSHKISVANSVGMTKLRVFIGGTMPTLLQLTIPSESSVRLSDKLLSLPETLKCIWSFPRSSVLTENESKPTELFLFETKL